MVKVNYKYEKRQKDMAKQRKKVEKAQRKAQKQRSADGSVEAVEPSGGGDPPPEVN